jgi:hypothetical protein
MPVPVDGHYLLHPEWFARIHSRDHKYQAPEYGLTEVEEEEFLARDWPEVGGADFALDVEEYQRAAARVKALLDQVFGRG